MNIDWELIIKAVGVVAGIVTTLIQIMLKVREFKPRERSILKYELEILNMLDKSIDNYDLVEARVNYRLNRLFKNVEEPVEEQKRNFNLFNIIYGALLFIGLGYWTISKIPGDTPWWTFIIGYFAFAGLFIMLKGFNVNILPTTVDEKTASKKEELNT